MTVLAPERRPRWGISGLRIGIVVSLVFLLLGFVSIVWTPYPVGAVDVAAALQDPGGAHWLGTDQLGRDVLSLLMKGVLTSFVVSAVGVALGALFGIPLGLAAFAWGRPADVAVAGVAGYLAAVPVLLAAVIFAALFGPSAATLMVAIGLGNIPAQARLTRDGLRRSGRLGYVEAGRLAGSSGLELLRRHVLPDLTRRLLALAIAQLAIGILAEAGLSYVGLGTQPPATSLGLLLHDASAYAAQQPSLVIVPGLTILVIVLMLNITSRGLSATAPLDPAPEADDGAA
jgi:peptide/nickel transport system permease protein